MHPIHVLCRCPSKKKNHEPEFRSLKEIVLDLLENAGALVALGLTLSCIAVWSVILAG